MKTLRYISIAASAALLFSSCDKYLDVMPDNRAELDTEEKITKLLVSAYPTNSTYLLEEMASDNAVDNGPKFDVENKSHEEAYLWEPVWTTSNDDVKSNWDAAYGAIAAANQALQAIEDMGSPESLSAQKAEALLCRAYGHFRLANLFCLAYNPETADKDLGLPYSLAPETQVKPEYSRGTMNELYANINADIEAALPFVDDNIYSVPKYHFNRNAAYAFAARFNLYYGKMDKVVEYATVAVGGDPTKVLRDWKGISNLASNWDVRVDQYISASEPANFLMLTTYSSWGYWGGPYSLGKRYGFAKAVFTSEGPRASGLWGTSGNLYSAKSCWGYDQKLAETKIGGYFQYTDKVAGIGYRMNVNVVFYADETLLCRAEAYARLGNYDKAVEDINYWIHSNTTSTKTFTLADIVKFYSGIKYTPVPVTNDNQRTVKKEINPLGFTISEGDQENLIQCILHLRRVATVHEGLRWMDIKRYGIVIDHNRDGLDSDILALDDPRRALQLPQDVIDAGLEANPRNN